MCSDCEACGLKKHGLTRSDCTPTSTEWNRPSSCGFVRDFISELFRHCKELLQKGVRFQRLVTSSDAPASSRVPV